MKTLNATLGLGAILVAGSAQATTIYNTLTTVSGSNQVNNFSNATAGSPLGNSFSVSGLTHVTSLSFELYDLNASTDGGSILVYLVSNDSSTNLSTSTGNQLNGATRLGTIQDSSLETTSGTLTTLAVDFTVDTGRHWIELAGSTDTNNGGTAGATAGLGAQKTRWSFNGGSAGTVGTDGEFSSVGTYPSGGSEAIQQFVNSPTIGNFQMSIETSALVPEPASLAILGISLIGLSVGRRRRAKNLAT